MGDLVEWLREQLDEDDRIARGTGQPGTSWQGLEMDGELRDDANAGTVAYIPRAETRAHIARHDPARVLREIDAKRQVLATHTITVEKVDAPPFDSFTGTRNPDEYTVTCAVCGWSSDDPTSACLTLRLLALPYADRPGYRDDWRP